jgi:hypothetical protein
MVKSHEVLKNHYTEMLPSRKFVFPIRQLMRTLFRCFSLTSVACLNIFVISFSFVRSRRKPIPPKASTILSYFEYYSEDKNKYIHKNPFKELY